MTICEGYCYDYWYDDGDDYEEYIDYDSNDEYKDFDEDEESYLR